MAKNLLVNIVVEVEGRRGVDDLRRLGGRRPAVPRHCGQPALVHGHGGYSLLTGAPGVGKVGGGSPVRLDQGVKVSGLVAGTHSFV